MKLFGSRNKVLISSILFCLFIVGFVVYSNSRSTYFYIGMSNPDGIKNLQVVINDQELFNDSIYYEPFGFVKIEKKIGVGWQELKFQITPDSCVFETQFSNILKKHILIEYIEGDLTSNSCYMRVSPMFREFYYH